MGEAGDAERLTVIRARHSRVTSARHAYGLHSTELLCEVDVPWLLAEVDRLTVERDGAQDASARTEFLAASIAVWREIDRLSAEPGEYRGLAEPTALRQRERRAWEAYRATLDAPAAGMRNAGG